MRERDVNNMDDDAYYHHLSGLDGSLASAISNNSAPSERIESLLPTITGENDGPDWHWIVKLVDGRFAYLTGVCDNTGWDCVSSLHISEEPTLEAVLRQVGEVERPILAAQLGVAS